jgi:hypothetical protein
MMTDLFEEDRATIHPSLIGFTQYRIERLVHFESHQTTTQAKTHNMLESFDYIFGDTCLLEKLGTVTHESRSPL